MSASEHSEKSPRRFEDPLIEQNPNPRHLRKPSELPGVSFLTVFLFLAFPIMMFLLSKKFSHQGLILQFGQRPQMTEWSRAGLKTGGEDVIVFVGASSNPGTVQVAKIEEGAFHYRTLLPDQEAFTPEVFPFFAVPSGSMSILNGGARIEAGYFSLIAGSERKVTVEFDSVFEIPPAVFLQVQHSHIDDKMVLPPIIEVVKVTEAYITVQLIRQEGKALFHSTPQGSFKIGWLALPRGVDIGSISLSAVAGGVELPHDPKPTIELTLEPRKHMPPLLFAFPHQPSLLASGRVNHVQSGEMLSDHNRIELFWGEDEDSPPSKVFLGKVSVLFAEAPGLLRAEAA